MAKNDSYLGATPEARRFADECEIRFANWCANTFNYAVHGIVSDKETNQDGYTLGVFVEHDARPRDNFKNGDVRTKHFIVDVKSSKDYPIASISVWVPINEIKDLLSKGKSEQAAGRILALKHLSGTNVDYYVSYGKNDKITVIPKQAVLDMLSEEGLEYKNKRALGEVILTKDTKVFGSILNVHVYLPLTSWSNQEPFRNQFMTLEDLKNIYGNKKII